MYRELDEQALASYCSKRDRLAEEELYRRYADRVFALCRRYVGDADEAKDLMLEALIQALDEVSPTALAYLVNALYFKSEWAEKFPKGNTQNETFTDEAGQKSQVKMMKLAGKEFNYGETDLCQIVNLPYGNGNFAMTVFLPKSGHTVSELTAEMAKGALPRFFGSAEVDLWLPRFETKYHIQLNGILCQLGMPSAFNPGKADFLAMSDQASYVDFVQQDAIVKVDEEGTEAAAVTVIGMECAAAAPPKKAVFHADHPFLYLITETSTGAVLFAGKYGGQ